MSSLTVDARYLLCPLPVIRTQDLMARMRPGDSLCVLCTVPGVLHDIPSWCRMHGHTVSDVTRQGDDIAITIDVGDSQPIRAGKR